MKVFPFLLQTIGLACMAQLPLVYAVKPQVISLESIPLEVLNSQITSYLSDCDLTTLRSVSKSLSAALEPTVKQRINEKRAIKIQLDTHTLTIFEFSKQSNWTLELLKIDLRSPDGSHKPQQSIIVPKKIQNLRSEFSPELFLEVLPNVWCSNCLLSVKLPEIIHQTLETLGFKKTENLKINGIIKLASNVAFLAPHFDSATSKLQELFPALILSEIVVNLYPNDVQRIGTNCFSKLFLRLKNVQKLFILGKLACTHSSQATYVTLMREITQLQTLKICHVENIFHSGTTDFKNPLPFALQQSPFLEELAIQYERLTPDDCIELANTLAKLPKMCLLDLKLTDRLRTQELPLTYHPNIRKSILTFTWIIRFSESENLNDTIRQICELAFHNILHVTLDFLCYRFPNDKEAKSVESFITSISALKHSENLNIKIVIDLPQLIDNQWQKGLNCLSKLRNMREITIHVSNGNSEDLQNCTSEPCDFEIQPFRLNLQKIIVIFDSMDSFEEIRYQKLAEFLSAHSTAQEITLEGSSERACKFITTSLKSDSLNSLKKIHLASSAIPAEYAASIFTTLLRSSQLRELHLALGELDKNGLKNLQTLLLSLKALEHLFINGLHLHYGGICSFIKAARQTLDHLPEDSVQFPLTFKITPDAKIMITSVVAFCLH
jgi:hypothetical protein